MTRNAPIVIENMNNVYQYSTLSALYRVFAKGAILHRKFCREATMGWV